MKSIKQAWFLLNSNCAAPWNMILGWLLLNPSELERVYENEISFQEDMKSRWR